MKKKIVRVLLCFRCWYRAHFLDYPYWRVSYGDTFEDTVLLYYREAWPLAKIFKGRLWIDYKTCAGFKNFEESDNERRIERQREHYR